MIARPLRPGLAPAAKTGTHFEPGHRQEVEITYPEPGTDWERATYNRETGRFWMRTGERWIECDVDVSFFRQLAPEPGHPVALTAVSWRSI